mgnify:CR=1 FL=1
MALVKCEECGKEISSIVDIKEKEVFGFIL